MPSPAATELPASVEISLDRLSVRLIPRPDCAPKALDAPALITHLAGLGIKLDARGEAEVQDFCRPRKAGIALVPAVVATGTPAVDDVPPSLEPVASTPQQAVQQVGQVRHVKAGDPVATLIPAKNGRDGIDVLGNPIPHRKADTAPMVDASLKATADGRAYVATIDGVVRFRGNGPARTIVVLPCLRHAGDLAGKVLHSPGEIVIEGAVTGASLRAGGDICVSGDIDNTIAMCDGDFSGAAFRAVKAEVAGNCSASSVNQSHITCGGELIVEKGDVVGGHVIASGGLRCKSIGSPEFAKTLIEVGIDHRLRDRLNTLLPDIEARLTKAAKIRQTVEPLLRSKQTLTPQQQLRVASLLAEADAIDARAQQARKELRQEYEEAVARCRTEVHITDVVYPGVTIRFPGAQTTARIALRGPCRICLEMLNGQSRIVLVQEGASGMPLELCKLPEDWRNLGKQLAA